jgi:hypothetical protein
LTPDVVKITPSSFNLTPCKLIKVKKNKALESENDSLN